MLQTCCSRSIPRPPWAAVLLFGAILAFGGPLGSSAWAAPDGPTRLTGFLPSGRYALYTGSQPVATARILYSASAGAYLVRAGVFKAGVLIYPRTGCVESVKEEEMVTGANGALDVVVSGMPCRHGKFRLEGANILFQVEDVSARLRPKPPLLGMHRAEGVIAHTPEYVQAGKRYRPNATQLDTLARSPTKARIIIFFGSWCKTCKRLLPNILKVQAELRSRSSGLVFEYFGLPAPPQYQRAPQVRQYGLQKLPAGLIYVGDRPLGRIQGNEWSRPEAALSRYIR